jgi:hypothetical protein
VSRDRQGTSSTWLFLSSVYSLGELTLKHPGDRFRATCVTDTVDGKVHQDPVTDQDVVACGRVSDACALLVRHSPPTLDSPASCRPSLGIDARAQKALETELFGIRVLFIERDNWSIAVVVAAYRSQSGVEADFRQMKDPKVVGFSPTFHWTEQKIRVHAQYCVVALAVARLMAREARSAGMTMSVRELLSSLGRIQKTVIYPSTGGRHRARRILTDMDPAQARLFERRWLGAEPQPMSSSTHPGCAASTERKSVTYVLFCLARPSSRSSRVRCGH